MLLLEESTLTEIPSFAANIFRNFDKKTTSQAELLFASAYCIALESGFYPLTVSDCNDLKVSSLYSYNSSNVLKISESGFPPQLSCVDEEFYRIEVQYPVKWLEDSSQEELCKTSILTGVKSSDFLIVTMTVDSLPGASVCLPMSRYILATTKKDFPYRLRNLKDLSRILKDDIFVPIRNSLLAECSAGPFPFLQGLPFDVAIHILGFIKSVKDLQNLSKTCKLLRDICMDEHLRRQ